MPEVTIAPPSDVPNPLPVERRHRLSTGSDAAYWSVLYIVSGVVAVVVAGFLLTIIISSIPAWQKHGLSLIYGTTWDATTNQYGAFPIIAGTIETTAIALILAVPVGLGTALAIVHLIPGRIRVVLSSLVELLASVPRSVYGLWGVFVLVPWFSATVQPRLTSLFGGHFPFQAPAEGYSVLLAGCVLFVMVLPLVVALSRDVIAIVPNEQVEGALSIGATKWQVIRKVVLPGARTGIIGAITLATARALGETIAVAMVIGNNPLFPKSLNSPGSTLASIIAVQFDGSTSDQFASLFALAVILMAITASVNWIGRRLVRRAAVRAGAV